MRTSVMVCALTMFLGCAGASILGAQVDDEKKIIEKAFGPESDESRFTIKVYKSDWSMLFLAESANITEQGRLEVEKFRLIRQEDKSGFAIISAPKATVTFEKKLTELKDLTKFAALQIAVEFADGSRVVIFPKK